MAYDKEKILIECLGAIKTEKLTFFNDLAEFVQPTMATLYEWEFDKLETLKNELAKNKIASKRKMRNKWTESDNATLQLAAYKLIANQEELDSLTMNKVEHGGGMSLTWKEERTYETK
jgi:hypothetical protein